MLRAKTVTFLRTESGLSALSSSWTYVAGQKGDISRHCAVYVCPTSVHLEHVGHVQAPRSVYVCPTSVHLEHVGRTVVFLTFLPTESPLSASCSSRTYSMLRAKKVTFLGTVPGLRLSYVSPSSVGWAHSCFLEGCFAEGDISRHRARSTFLLR